MNKFCKIVNVPKEQSFLLNSYKHSAVRGYISIITFAVTFVAFALGYILLCDSYLQYTEHWRTFYYDWNYICEETGKGNLFTLIWDFVTQFFYHKYLGILLMSAILATITVVCRKIISFISQNLLINLLPSLALSVFIFLSTTDFNAENKAFMHQSCLVRENNWQEILNENKNKRISNLLFQNIHNMALAETGLLGEHFYDNPCMDFTSIIIQNFNNPKIAALASDVYYSMGHMAFSQRLAFEVNEKYGDFSPRMLQRLVQTNIAYGHYAVAEKYLRWLEKTLFYRKWAAHYRAMLYDDEAVMSDPEMREKRLAIFPDNRFSGIKGLDDDLLQIVMANPENTKTRDYLAAIYILAGRDYQEKYNALIESYFPDKDNLPKYFMRN